MGWGQINVKKEEQKNVTIRILDLYSPFIFFNINTENCEYPWYSAEHTVDL